MKNVPEPMGCYIAIVKIKPVLLLQIIPNKEVGRMLDQSCAFPYLSIHEQLVPEYV